MAAAQALGRVYLVMEYCGGGDLAQYIGKNGTVRAPPRP